MTNSFIIRQQTITPSAIIQQIQTMNPCIWSWSIIVCVKYAYSTPSWQMISLSLPIFVSHEVRIKWIGNDGLFQISPRKVDINFSIKRERSPISNRPYTITCTSIQSKSNSIQIQSIMPITCMRNDIYLGAINKSSKTIHRMNLNCNN